MRLTSEHIEGLFEQLNKRYYGGTLPRPVFFGVETGRTWYARVVFKRRKVNKEKTRFKLSVCTDWNWDKLNLSSVILHEMVHIHNEILGLEIKKTRAPFIAHNFAFIKECIRLRKKFGVSIPVFGWEVKFNKRKEQ